MIKVLDFGGNNFLSTHGLTLFISKHIVPWNKVNSRIFRFLGKSNSFSVLKADHNVDDTNAYRLTQFL
jgi:hypothetical protein